MDSGTWEKKEQQRGLDEMKFEMWNEVWDTKWSLRCEINEKIEFEFLYELTDKFGISLLGTVTWNNQNGKIFLNE